MLLIMVFVEVILRTKGDPFSYTGLVHENESALVVIQLVLFKTTETVNLLI